MSGTAGGRRVYVRDRQGQFAETPGGSSESPRDKYVREMLAAARRNEGHTNASMNRKHKAVRDRAAAIKAAEAQKQRLRDANVTDSKAYAVIDAGKKVPSARKPRAKGYGNDGTTKKVRVKSR